MAAGPSAAIADDNGDDMANTQLGVGMVGHAFMGTAHSQAWRTAPHFLDLPLHPPAQEPVHLLLDRSAGLPGRQWNCPGVAKVAIGATAERDSHRAHNRKLPTHPVHHECLPLPRTIRRPG